MYQYPHRKKRGKWWIALLFICSIAVGLGVGYAGAKIMTLPDRIEALPKESEAPATSEASPQVKATDIPSKAVSINYDVASDTPKMPAKEGYLVKTTDGKVCVYKIHTDGTTTYSQTLPVELSDLPESDRNKLEKGIYLETRTELAELTEDYSS